MKEKESTKTSKNLFAQCIFSLISKENAAHMIMLCVLVCLSLSGSSSPPPITFERIGWFERETDGSKVLNLLQVLWK